MTVQEQHPGPRSHTVTTKGLNWQTVTILVASSSMSLPNRLDIPSDRDRGYLISFFYDLSSFSESSQVIEHTYICLVQVGNGIELEAVGLQFEPYRWRPCGVTWDSSRTVVVIKLRRTSALHARCVIFFFLLSRAQIESGRELLLVILSIVHNDP